MSGFLYSCSHNGSFLILYSPNNRDMLTNITASAITKHEFRNITYINLQLIHNPMSIENSLFNVML